MTATTRMTHGHTNEGLRASFVKRRRSAASAVDAPTTCVPPTLVRMVLALSWLVLLGGAVLASPKPNCCAQIPARSPDAPTGAEFVDAIATASGSAREKAIFDELADGNIPSFLRLMKPVELTHTPRRGSRISAVIWVMPDYLAVGSNEDFLRVPIALPTAVRIARRFDLMLPTRKMVDAIHDQSDFRFKPEPMKHGHSMTSTAYYARHNALIEEQRRGHGLRELVSGHKKDVVLTKRLWTRRGRVAIYGWHRRSGRAIQPLSTVHGARYADYSHGVRLVASSCLVNGEVKSIVDVLQDPKLAPVLAYEGVIRNAESLMKSLTP